MRHIKRKILSLFMALVCVGQLAACGDAQTASGEEIELLEPVGMSLFYEEAQYRNIFNYKTYVAHVCPEVEEYAFQADQQVERYVTQPGEEIKSGQEIAAGDTKKIEEQIKDKQKAIDESEEEYIDKRADLLDNLAKYKADAAYWEEVVERSLGQKPAESDASFADWSNAHFQYEKNLSTNVLARDKAQAALDQCDALYELDSKHAKFELQELKKKREEAVLSAKTDGVLVASKMYVEMHDWWVQVGLPWVKKGTSVAAVGDLDKKCLKSNYVAKYYVSSAQEVYAFINGKRYEVEYVPMDDDEYEKLSQVGTVYSTFYFTDEVPEVNIGDFAEVVVVNNKLNNVLTVDRNSIHKEGAVEYVYLVNGTEKVYTPVKTGKYDNKYIEILSGLKEGDKVEVDSANPVFKETAKTTVGNIEFEFKSNGVMYYPSSNEVKNPVKYGSCYFVENHVERLDRVEKGQVLATVRVVKDDIALTRNETQINRMKQRLADYKAGFSDNPAGLEEKSVKKYIESQQEQIDKLQETIDKIKQDGATTEIKASVSGLVTGIHSHKEDDLLQSEETMFVIADESSNYLIVEDKNHVLDYSNEITISYKLNGVSKQAIGTVAVISQYGLKPDLASDYMMIMVDKEDLREITSGTGEGGRYGTPMRYTVTAKVRKMNNVVLVPKNAVSASGDQNFVYVKRDDGKIVETGIITGGSDNDYFWVIDGLTEGMEVCLK